jgi:hypothetical protein
MTKTEHKFPPAGDQVRLLSDIDPMVNPLDIDTIPRQLPSPASVGQNREKREGGAQKCIFGGKRQLMTPQPARVLVQYEQMQARQRQQQRTRNADALAWARCIARHTVHR